MTNQEYAAIIYRHVFHITDNGDAYTSGIIKELSTLDPREQLIPDSHYRRGKTFAR